VGLAVHEGDGTRRSGFKPAFGRRSRAPSFDALLEAGMQLDGDYRARPLIF